MNKISKYLLGGTVTMLTSLFIFQNSMAMEGPDSVEINSLAQLYEPVAFNHVMHVDVAGDDCATCHHHATGTPVTDSRCKKCHANSGPTDEVACQACHSAKRFEAEYLQQLDENKTIHHDDKVGLKAAYHLKCMGCHQEVGAPNGCQDCHARTDAGDKIFHSGKYAPAPGKKAAGGGH